MPDVDEPIAIEEYDSAAPERFEREAARLRGGLGAAAIAIEHIGSTAVPGLAGKPIVDMMVGVADLADTDALAARLPALGYVDCGGAADRRYFRARSGAQAFNVHLIEVDGPTWHDNILLREYLRREPDAARVYAEAKRAAADEAATLLPYSRLKAPTVDALLTKARARANGPRAT